MTLDEAFARQATLSTEQLLLRRSGMTVPRHHSPSFQTRSWRSSTGRSRTCHDSGLFHQMDTEHSGRPLPTGGDEPDPSSPGTAARPSASAASGTSARAIGAPRSAMSCIPRIDAGPHDRGAVGRSRIRSMNRVASHGGRPAGVQRGIPASCCGSTSGTRARFDSASPSERVPGPAPLRTAALRMEGSDRKRQAIGCHPPHRHTSLHRAFRKPTHRKMTVNTVSTTQSNANIPGDTWVSPAMCWASWAA